MREGAAAAQLSNAERPSTLNTAEPLKILKNCGPPLRVAQLLHGQLLLQADLLLLLQGQVVKAASHPSLPRVCARLPRLVPPPRALQSFAAQILPAQAHNCPHRLCVCGILRMHSKQVEPQKMSLVIEVPYAALISGTLAAVVHTSDAPI